MESKNIYLFCDYPHVSHFQDPSLDPHSQNRGGADATRRPSQSAANMKKASSTTNIVDDLSSIFGGLSSIPFLTLLHLHSLE